MKKTLKVIFLSLVTMSAVMATGCETEVELQAFDILSQELGTDFNDSFNNWHYTATLNSSVEGQESYTTLFNTEYGTFRVDLDIDQFCDVTDYSIAPF